MRFSEAWLREWVDPPIDTQQLVSQLSMSGLEVDAVEPAAAAFSGVVVGYVEALDAHPDAEKLRVCRVDVGEQAPLQIVCGAANVAAGMKVPVAMVGARLPGDFKIKRAKLRGVESLGMICSASELGLAESSDGIMVLPPESPLGEDLRAFMALDDQCIELDLTPDRGDCLSVAGVAREVGVLNRVNVRRSSAAAVAPASDARHAVEVRAESACPRYLCRVISGIDPGARTPLWMQERLRRGGERPISAVVDVTNYVLLELGQPLHAFDRDLLQGGIEVRMARAGEPLALLNGEEIALRDDTLVIADAARPVALAGIMGGSATAVGEDSVNILLESAFFAPTAITGKARSYGLHTESSHRFERGVDPALQEAAIERATALLLDIVGGQAGPIVSAASQAHLPQAPALALKRARISQVLGIEIGDEDVTDILGRLGMSLEAVDDGWRVTPPTSRFDILLEVDLIAEIGRIYGYDRIPVTHARSAAVTRAPLEMSFDLDRCRQLLVDRGYHEAVTYSFVAPELQSLVDPDSSPLCLANPLSAEMSAMRTTLWVGLLQAARQNLARQQMRVRLFESGLRFRRDGGDLHQEPMLAGLAVGPVQPEQWAEPGRAADFFDLKADLQALLGASASAAECRFEPASHAALHPGKSARILRGERTVGWAGTIHPALASKLDLPEQVQLFELMTSDLGSAPKPAFVQLSKYPSIRRDIAIVVDIGVAYAAVRGSIEAAAGEWLRDLVLFDVYVGDKIDSGRKSMALGLILQAPSQTLTDQEVESVVGGVLRRLEADCGAQLRS